MALNTTEFIPEMMNIELTTVCPLRCPQCYCSLTGGKHIDLETAVYWLKEGGKHGVKAVMLSGGETLCYPHIYEVIAAANRYCGVSNIALSGFGFTEAVLEWLLAVDISGIFISLNGSTEAINALTRDGFDLAIAALKLLDEKKFPETYINWVMHANNSDDFPNVVAIAERYHVKSVVVMAFKPDANHQLRTIPSKEQMMNIKRFIMAHKGTVKIRVESCFSPMLAVLLDTKLFGNLNVGKNSGCVAGRYTFSVNVDGLLSPCRHLEYFEKHAQLADYWHGSQILHKLRALDVNRREPCSTCGYSNFCRHCLAINSKMKGDLFIGYEACPLPYETMADVK